MSMPEDEFDRLETELSRALRRVDAPAGMADVVIGRAMGQRSGVVAFPRMQVWMGSAAASLLVMGLVLGGVERHRAAERARAEHDFARSLEITQRALSPVRDRLQRAGIELEE